MWKIAFFSLLLKIQQGKSHSANNIVTDFDIVIGGERLISRSKGKRRGLKRECTSKLSIPPPLKGGKIYSWGSIAHTPLLLLFLLTSLFSMSVLISVWVTKTRSGPQRFPLRQNLTHFEHQGLTMRDKTEGSCLRSQICEIWPPGPVNFFDWSQGEFSHLKWRRKENIMRERFGMKWVWSERQRDGWKGRKDKWKGWTGLRGQSTKVKIPHSKHGHVVL